MKKNKLVGVFVLLFIFFLLILAFSMWLLSNRNYSINNLEISYNEQNNNNGLYPMSDAEGIKTNPYIFKITNNGSSVSKYKVLITDITDGHNDDELLNRKQIHYQLKMNGGFISSGNLSDIKDNVLTTNSISSLKTDTYELRIWLSDSSIETNWMGKYYNYNISVKSIKK